MLRKISRRYETLAHSQGGFLGWRQPEGMFKVSKHSTAQRRRSHGQVRLFLRWPQPLPRCSSLWVKKKKKRSFVEKFFLVIAWRRLFRQQKAGKARKRDQSRVAHPLTHKTSLFASRREKVAHIKRVKRRMPDRMGGTRSARVGVLSWFRAVLHLAPRRFPHPPKPDQT